MSNTKEMLVTEDVVTGIEFKKALNASIAIAKLTGHPVSEEEIVDNAGLIFDAAIEVLKRQHLLRFP